MRRKLINYDAFKKIEQDSLTAATKELSEAAPIIAKALQVEGLSLRSYGAETVMFETVDGSFIHANYQIKNGKINLNNIEQVVVDEADEKKETRDLLNKMVESLIDNNEKAAETLFNEYISLPLTRRVFNESKKVEAKKDKKHDCDDKMRLAGKKVTKMGKLNNLKKKKKVVMEWKGLCENVADYLDYKEFGPQLKQVAANTDERGNVVELSVPTTKIRNEHKLLSFNWKTLNTDVVVKRSSAKMVSEDVNFCKAVADLKRHNNMSDNAALEESLENIVTNWPQVLYLTQSELAETVKAALETARCTNFQDSDCDFMAEGILRVAHEAYVDRVDKIMKLAGSTVQEDSKDKYADFKKTVDRFYPSLDETTLLEMQVFVDLYEAIRHVHETAKAEDNHSLKAEAVRHLQDLAAIIQKESEPTLETAEHAAEWLWNIVETNLETSDWQVSNSPHITTSGDHPDMAKKAATTYAPSKDFSGNWGDSAPVSDGKNYKGGLADEMRDRSWSNIGGNDVYPSLDNPYYKVGPDSRWQISGEKTIDNDSDPLAHSGGSDTWPNLSNPFVPQSVISKMNHGKESDLVVDK